MTSDLPLHADDALRGLEGFHRSGRLGVLGRRGCARFLLLRRAGCCLVRPCTTLQVVASSVLAPAHLHHCRQDAPPQQAAPYTHLLQVHLSQEGGFLVGHLLLGKYRKKLLGATGHQHLLDLWIHVTLSLLKTLGFAVKQLLVLDEPVVVLLLLLLSLHLAHHPLQVLRPLLLPLHQVHQQARQLVPLVLHQLCLELNLHVPFLHLDHGEGGELVLHHGHLVLDLRGAVILAQQQRLEGLPLVLLVFQHLCNNFLLLFPLGSKSPLHCFVILQTAGHGLADDPLPVRVVLGRSLPLYLCLHLLLHCSQHLRGLQLLHVALDYGELFLHGQLVGFHGRHHLGGIR